jgi:hypothetical protein
VSGKFMVFLLRSQERTDFAIDVGRETAAQRAQVESEAEPAKWLAMSHFGDLPRRNGTHEPEEAAVVAFQTKLAESCRFILQGADRKDYGTDCQIEMIADRRVIAHRYSYASSDDPRGR